MKQYNVGVIGATGMVGQRFITLLELSLIHISEPTRRTPISYAVFCLKKKKKEKKTMIRTIDKPIKAAVR